MLKKLDGINKTELSYLLIIFLIFVLLIFISFGKWGYPIIDCFRNAYLPAEIIKGKILYKDIFYFYCPLIPYFHTLLFKIFGVHLNVLYFSGILSSLIILFSLYYLSRNIMEPLPALFFTILFEIIVIFRPGIFQFIFPYAYEATYGFMLELFLLIFLVKFINHNFESLRYIYWAASIISISSLVKQDVFLSSYLIFYLSLLIFLIFKKVSIKKLIIPVIISMLLPITFYTYILLFIPFESLFSGLFPINIFNNYFLTNYSGIFIDNEIISTVIQTFLKRFVAFTILIALFYVLISAFKSKHKNFLILIPLALVGLYIGFYISNTPLPLSELGEMYNLYTHLWVSPNAFQWIALFSLLFTLYSILYLRIKRYKSDNKLFLLIIISISGFLVLIRAPFAAVTQSFANIYIGLALMTLIYFLIYELPYLFPKLEPSYYKWSVYISIWFVILPIFIFYYQQYELNNIKISSNRGFIYTTAEIGQIIQESINYVKANSIDKDTILTAPEEIVINFMADRSNATKYYQFLPDFIKPGSTELRVIEEIKRNDPKIILISNNNVVRYYGKMYWGIDFNQAIYNWINKNYKTCGSIGLYTTSDRYYSYGIEIMKPDCN